MPTLEYEIIELLLYKIKEKARILKMGYFLILFSSIGTFFINI
jgi:hypothetical protein